MSDRTDDRRRAEDKPPPKPKPASEAPPVTGPNAPAAGQGDGCKTDDNRKGGYGTG